MTFAAMNRSSLPAVRFARAAILGGVLSTISLAAHAADADWGKVASTLGNDDAQKLAQGLRAALDKVNVARS